MSNLNDFQVKFFYHLQSEKSILFEQNEKYNWKFKWDRDRDLHQDRELIKCNGYVFKNHHLEKLQVSSRMVQKLDLCPFLQLKELYCSGTNITNLDLHNCTQLTHIDC